MLKRHVPGDVDCRWPRLLLSLRTVRLSSQRASPDTSSACSWSSDVRAFVVASMTSPSHVQRAQRTAARHARAEASRRSLGGKEQVQVLFAEPIGGSGSGGSGGGWGSLGVEVAPEAGSIIIKVR